MSAGKAARLDGRREKFATARAQVAVGVCAARFVRDTERRRGPENFPRAPTREKKKKRQKITFHNARGGWYGVRKIRVAPGHVRRPCPGASVGEAHALDATHCRRDGPSGTTRMGGTGHFGEGCGNKNLNLIIIEKKNKLTGKLMGKIIHRDGRARGMTEITSGEKKKNSRKKLDTKKIGRKKKKSTRSQATTRTRSERTILSCGSGKVARAKTTTGDDRLLSVRGGINYTRTYTRDRRTAQSVTRSRYDEWGDGGGGGGGNERTAAMRVRRTGTDASTCGRQTGRRRTGECAAAARASCAFFFIIHPPPPPVHTAVRPVGGTPLCVSAAAAAAIVCGSRAPARVRVFTPPPPPPVTSHAADRRTGRTVAPPIGPFGNVKRTPTVRDARCRSANRFKLFSKKPPNVGPKGGLVFQWRILGGEGAIDWGPHPKTFYSSFC